MSVGYIGVFIPQVYRIWRIDRHLFKQALSEICYKRSFVFDCCLWADMISARSIVAQHGETLDVGSTAAGNVTMAVWLPRDGSDPHPREPAH
jgi:hypothetical protein